MKRFLYELGWAIVNWFEATVILLSLGLYNPNWVFQYAKWHTLLELKKEKN